MTKGFSDGVKRLTNGSWLVRLMVDGKVREKRFEKKQEALDFRETVRKKRLARDLGLTLPSAPILPQVVTLGSILDNYETESKIAGRSKESLATIVQTRKVCQEWRGLGASAELRRADFSDLILWLDKARNAGRRSLHKHVIVCLRTAMKLADIPLPSVPSIAIPAERRQRTIEKDVLNTFLAALPENSPEKIAAFIALFTGARQAEIYRLKFEDVDIEAGKIYLDRHKGRATARRKVDVVPIHPALEVPLRAYLASVPQGLTPQDPFLGLTKRRNAPAKWHAVNRCSLGERLRRRCRKAGIPERSGLGFLRHEFATVARSSGAVSLTEAAKALSHGSSRITDRHYDESDISDRAAFEASLKAAEAISQAMGIVGEQGGGPVN
jgi:integrase